MNFSSPVDLERERQKRLEYERVAESLKPLLLKKDSNWLSAMVNSSHTNSQRILLSKLLEENRLDFEIFIILKYLTNANNLSILGK